MLAHLEGTHRLMGRLLYGTGMRIMECLRLRVKDLDLRRGEIVVRHGKGGRDRVTMAPHSLAAELTDQLARSRVHRQRPLPGKLRCDGDRLELAGT